VAAAESDAARHRPSVDDWCDDGPQAVVGAPQASSQLQPGRRLRGIAAAASVGYEWFGCRHHSDRQVGPYFVARYELDVWAFEATIGEAH
jgi:hypothetical protein